MATQKVRPEPGALERQQDHQHRRDRRRKTAAIALVAIIAIAAAVFVIRTAAVSDRSQPAVSPSLTPSPLGAVTPDGDYTLDLNTGVMTPLPASIVGEAREANWYALSPDGSQVAYVASGGDGNPEIFVANLDGTGIRRVTNRSADVIPDSWSAWSPDGSMIAYEGWGEGAIRNLFVVDVETGVARQVTSSTHDDVYGAQFSTDGSALLYAGGDESAGVRLAPIEGGRGTLLVGGGGKKGDAGNGVLSPDGTMLSFAFNETVGAFPAGVWIANADGTDAQQLIDVFLECRPGSWSPDLTRLACWELDGSRVILIDVGTGALNVVAEGTSAIWLDDRTLLVDR